MAVAKRLDLRFGRHSLARHLGRIARRSMRAGGWRKV
jgi:hypothetical protein